MVNHLEAPTIRNTALAAVYEAAPIIMNGFRQGNEIRYKGENYDYLTKTDVDAETVIRRVIREAYPGHKIEGEEQAIENSSAKPTWFFDPISGTVNFAHGLHGFSTALTFALGNEPQFSVVYDPILQEIFWADKETAYRQDRPNSTPERLRPTKKSDIHEAIIFAATKGPEDKKDKTRFYEDYWPTLIGNIRTFRRIGSLALEQAYIAAGRVDAQVHFPSDKYAIPAGKHILERVGGLVTDFQGRPWTRESLTVVASNGEKLLHEGIVEILSPFTPRNTPVH